MHDYSKSTRFIALRANGWSLARISKDLTVAKATLWAWDSKYQAEIFFLKHLQLERLQEKFLPSYEEELSQLHSLLERVESALQRQDFAKMGPEFLLQMSLQIRTRLARMREQLPLRTLPDGTPIEDLPLTGCISRQNMDALRAELSLAEDENNSAGPPPATHAEPEPGNSAPAGADHPHPRRNGKHPVSGNGHCDPKIRVHPCSSVVPPRSVSPPGSAKQNRTFPNEIPGGQKSEPSAPTT